MEPVSDEHLEAVRAMRERLSPSADRLPLLDEDEELEDEDEELEDEDEDEDDEDDEELEDEELEDEELEDDEDVRTSATVGYSPIRPTRSSPWLTWGIVAAAAGAVWWACSRGWLPGCGREQRAQRALRQQQQMQKQLQQRQRIAQRLQQPPPVPAVQRQRQTRPVVLRFFPDTRDPGNRALPWATEVVMPDGRAVFVHGYQRDPRENAYAGEPDMDVFGRRLVETLRRARSAYPTSESVAIEDYRSPSTGQPALAPQSRDWFEEVVGSVYPPDRVRFQAPADIERSAPRPPQSIMDLIAEMDGMLQEAAEGQVPSIERLSRVFAGTPDQLTALTPEAILWNRSQLYAARDIMQRENYRPDRPGRYDTGARTGPGPADVEHIVLQFGPEGAYRIQLSQQP